MKTFMFSGRAKFILKLVHILLFDKLKPGEWRSRKAVSLWRSRWTSRDLSYEDSLEKSLSVILVASSASKHYTRNYTPIIEDCRVLPLRFDCLSVVEVVKDLIFPSTMFDNSAKTFTFGVFDGSLACGTVESSSGSSSSSEGHWKILFTYDEVEEYSRDSDRSV